MVGNNGISSSITNTSDLPTDPGTNTPMRMRLGRIWKGQLTGTISTLTLQFDLTGAFSSTVVYDPSELCLLIDRGNTGSFANASLASGSIVTTPTLVSGNVYQFAGITLKPPIVTGKQIGRAHV